MIVPAHYSSIISICSLSKLDNKYFATRCLKGDIGIWSANNHPDRVFLVEGSGEEVSERDKFLEIKPYPELTKASTVVAILRHL